MHKRSIWVDLINLWDKEVTLTQGTKFSKAHELSISDNKCVNVLNEGFHTETLTDGPISRELSQDDIECHGPKMVKLLLKLLNQHRPSSWITGENLGHYTGDPPGIKLKDEKVVINKMPYRIPHARKDSLKSEIDKILQQGVISRSKSIFNSPLILVTKALNQVRICIDF